MNERERLDRLRDRIFEVATQERPNVAFAALVQVAYALGVRDKMTFGEVSKMLLKAIKISEEIFNESVRS